ncbi:hypothetical protein ACFX13_036963 [Malus domestica]
MIRGHAWSETPRKFVELYKRLVHKRVLVSWFGGGVEYARLVFDGMRERSVASWNSLLAGYVWCRDVDGVQRIFNEISKWNVVSWTTMIVGCAQNGRYKQALSLFGNGAIISLCQKGDLNL